MSKKIISRDDCMYLVLREMTNISLRMPQKEAKKLLFMIDKMYNLIHFPFETRFEDEYEFGENW